MTPKQSPFIVTRYELGTPYVGDFPSEFWPEGVIRYFIVLALFPEEAIEKVRSTQGNYGMFTAQPVVLP